MEKWIACFVQMFFYWTYNIIIYYNICIYYIHIRRGGEFASAVCLASKWYFRLDVLQRLLSSQRPNTHPFGLFKVNFPFGISLASISARRSHHPLKSVALTYSLADSRAQTIVCGVPVVSFYFLARAGVWFGGFSNVTSCCSSMWKNDPSSLVQKECCLNLAIEKKKVHR